MQRDLRQTEFAGQIAGPLFRLERGLGLVPGWVIGTMNHEPLCCEFPEIKNLKP